MDTRLRAEGQRLREQVCSTLDVEAGLADLLEERRRRRWRAGLATAVAAAAAAAVITSVAGWVPSDDPTPPPAVAPTSPPSSTASTTPAGCGGHEAVQCLGDGVRVRGPVTYRIGIPDGFVLDTDLSRAPLSVQALRQHADGGVAVIIGVGPADETARTDARGLATWVADRPFLDAGEVTRAPVGGLPAWSVRVALDVPPATVPDPSCNEFPLPCWAVLREEDGWETGLWPEMSSRYWFVDLPGNQVLGVWSFSREAGGLRANQRLVRAIVIESVS